MTDCRDKLKAEVKIIHLCEKNVLKVTQISNIYPEIAAWSSYLQKSFLLTITSDRNFAITYKEIYRTPINN
ncbi:hypothetical protein [Nostoc sp.]|uniref:hypothetical protein n=1 Tax=Nostoc sp. TaxID=1180 RepID=UPI002FFCBC29